MLQDKPKALESIREAYGYEEFLAGDLSCDLLDCPHFFCGRKPSDVFGDLQTWVYIGPGAQQAKPEQITATRCSEAAVTLQNGEDQRRQSKATLR